MKHFLIAVVMAAVCAMTINAQVANGSMWTDGMSFYKATVKKGGKVVMEGGTLHEGGFKFVLKQTAKKKYTVHPGHSGDDYITMGSHCKDGYRVMFENVGGRNVLTCYNAEGQAVAMLQQFSGSLEEFINNNRYEAFAGQYEDVNTGKKWIFFYDGKYEIGQKGPSPHYTVVKEYEMPSDIIRLADGTAYKVDITAQGINLRACKLIGYQDGEVEGAEVGDVVAVLNRTKSPYAAGKWSVCAFKLLSPAMLSMYDKATLRLMRNEIFARRGWGFQSDDLTAYFNQQPWYNALVRNEAVNLTELEKKNAEIIKMVEDFGFE